LIAPAGVQAGALVVFSGRGVAPAGTASPTEYLARRLARAAGGPDIPIVRATQVHRASASAVREAPDSGACVDAGEHDVIVTTLPGVALVVQTADCVPILLRSAGAVAAAHAGCRGSAANAARAAVEALTALGVSPAEIDAWIGPSIGPCCYEVGGEVASQFAGDFARRDCAGKFRLDLKAVNAAQLQSAGIASERISVHPGCTKCGGERYASYRRDGSAAGRMIAMIARRAC